jgi:hypothetical protein
MVVDGNPLAEEEADGEGALPSVVADGSNSKVLLHLPRKIAVWSVGLDDDNVGWGGVRR